MQFGIGLLGKGWTPEQQISRVMSNLAPAHPNFHLHAERYAARIAAETILAEPATQPTLTPDWIVRKLALCARPVRLSEVQLVIDAYKRIYVREVI